MGCQWGYIVAAAGGKSRPQEYSLERTTGVSSEEGLPVKKNEKGRQAEGCSARVWSQEGPAQPSGWRNCEAHVRNGGNRARDSRQGRCHKEPSVGQTERLSFCFKGHEEMGSWINTVSHRAVGSNLRNKHTVCTKDQIQLYKLADQKQGGKKKL